MSREKTWSEKIYADYLAEYKTKSLADLIECLFFELLDGDGNNVRIRAIKECINLKEKITK